MPELQVIARHTIKAGHEEQVLTLLAKLVEAARTEPGNISFDAYRSFEEPRSYVLLERYTSKQAFEEHRQTLHFKQYLLEGILPLLEDRVIEQYNPLD